MVRKRFDANDDIAEAWLRSRNGSSVGARQEWHCRHQLQVRESNGTRRESKGTRTRFIVVPDSSPASVSNKPPPLTFPEHPTNTIDRGKPFVFRGMLTL